MDYHLCICGIKVFDYDQYIPTNTAYYKCKCSNTNYEQMGAPQQRSSMVFENVTWVFPSMQLYNTPDVQIQIPYGVAINSLDFDWYNKFDFYHYPIGDDEDRNTWEFEDCGSLERKPYFIPPYDNNGNPFFFAERTVGDYYLCPRYWKTALEIPEYRPLLYQKILDYGGLPPV